MTTHSQAVITMTQWMENNNAKPHEINALHTGADTQHSADRQEFEDELFSPREAILAEIGNFLSTYDNIIQAAMDYLPDGWEDEDIHPLVETGDENNAASALYFRAESYVAEYE